MELQNYFEREFEKADKVIPFNPEWANGTGYFNGAVLVDVPSHQIWASQSDAPDSRRLLLIGTLMGTFVVFERYTPGHGDFVLVSNTPRSGERLLRCGQIGWDTFQDALQLPGTVKAVYNAVYNRVKEKEPVVA